MVEQLEEEKDMLSVGALLQGTRRVDVAHRHDDTIDPQEWQAVSRAMRKAMGEGAPAAGRAERLEKAFDEEAAAARKRT